MVRARCGSVALLLWPMSAKEPSCPPSRKRPPAFPSCHPVIVVAFVGRATPRLRQRLAGLRRDVAERATGPERQGLGVLYFEAIITAALRFF
jgi:hypothetical protein